LTAEGAAHAALRRAASHRIASRRDATRTEARRGEANAALCENILSANDRGRDGRVQPQKKVFLIG